MSARVLFVLISLSLCHSLCAQEGAANALADLVDVRIEYSVPMVDGYRQSDTVLKGLRWEVGVILENKILALAALLHHQENNQRRSRGESTLPFVAAAEDMVALPTGDRNWSKFITVDVLPVTEEGGVPESGTQLQARKELSAALTIGIQTKADGMASAVAIGERPVTAATAVGPDMLAGLMNGDYIVQVVYDTRMVADGQVVQGTATGQSLPFTLREPKDVREQLGVKYALAQEALAQLHYAEAEQLANEILAVDGSYMRGALLLMMGDIRFGQAEYEAALTHWSDYIKQLGPNAHPMVVQGVRRKIAAAKEKLGL